MKPLPPPEVPGKTGVSEIRQCYATTADGLEGRITAAGRTRKAKNRCYRYRNHERYVHTRGTVPGVGTPSRSYRDSPITEAPEIPDPGAAKLAAERNLSPYGEHTR